MKSYGLTALTDDITKQPSIDCVVRLLVASLTQIYSEKDKLNKEKYKTESSMRKCKGIRKCKQIKENPDAKWNKASIDLRTRSHPAKLPTCEKN